MYTLTPHLCIGLFAEGGGGRGASGDPVLGRTIDNEIIQQTVTHSLVILKMGKIISRNMLS